MTLLVVLGLKVEKCLLKYHVKDHSLPVTPFPSLTLHTPMVPLLEVFMCIWGDRELIQVLYQEQVMARNCCTCTLIFVRFIQLKFT